MGEVGHRRTLLVRKSTLESLHNITHHQGELNATFVRALCQVHNQSEHIIWDVHFFKISLFEYIINNVMLSYNRS